ncbi:ovarian cancer-associated 2 protein-like protein [Moniliophthora roreri]|uniref:Putative FSH1-domain-containing protein n=1 Tax=Moniliophthora roreri TaxID=221103 RepID=A0A0W0FH77_MONRR|nr:ovarian cancer-associated 2 protein-like protein [Moniliophthora roreri]
MVAAATKKILVLHGYAQNANIFSKKLGAIRKQCKDVEMIFLDAPHVLTAADLFGDTPEALDSASDPTLTPRGWWKFADSTKTTYVGLEATLDFIRDTLKSMRFDGILGFSQGAGLATLITALVGTLCLRKFSSHRATSLKGRIFIRPSWSMDNHHTLLCKYLILSFLDQKLIVRRSEYCVSVSGFKPRDSISETVLSPGFSTPTLHILGKTDAIVTGERSKLILEVTLNKRVEEHEGGHFVPSKANWRKFLSAYLTEGPWADIPSPSSISVSAPPSGTVTPTTEAQMQAVVVPLVPPPV